MQKQTFLSLLFLARSFLSVAECPSMFHRFQWGADNPLQRIEMPQNVSNIVIHHSATRTCTTVPDCIAIIKSFQRNHMTERGWDDIAYSFLIGGDGNLYEGRGWGVQVQGTQPPEWNYLGYTFCIIGSFDGELPTPKQLQVVQKLISCATEEGKYVTVEYNLKGHRDVYEQTSCPGNDLYSEIQSWPNYNVTN